MPAFGKQRWRQHALRREARARAATPHEPCSGIRAQIAGLGPVAKQARDDRERPGLRRFRHLPAMVANGVTRGLVQRMPVCQQVVARQIRQRAELMRFTPRDEPPQFGQIRAQRMWRAARTIAQEERDGLRIVAHAKRVGRACERRSSVCRRSPT